MIEAEIAELLRGNDRAHPMADDERDRIRAVLGLDQDSSVASGLSPQPTAAAEVSGDVVRIDATPSRITSSTGIRQPRRLAWLAAAVAVAIAGFAVSVQGLGDNGQVETVASEPAVEAEPTASVATPVPAPTSTVEGRAFCAGPFTMFAEAMTAWRGVDGWSRLVDERNPEPHLPDVATTALDALDPMVDAQVAARKQAMLDELDGAVGSTSRVREERTNAILTTVAFMNDAIEADLASGSSHFLECDLVSFNAAALPPE